MVSYKQGLPVRVLVPLALFPLSFQCNAVHNQWRQKIEYLHHFTDISFVDVWIGDEGCKALAQGLVQNVTVKSVNIGCNEIGDEGCMAFAHAVENNDTITAINLRGNLITSEGCKALAHALQRNSEITSVNLRSNHIGDEGCRALIELMNHNSAITSINVAGNHISPRVLEELERVVSSNDSFSSNKSSHQGSLSNGKSSCNASFSSDKGHHNPLLPSCSQGPCDSTSALADRLHELEKSNGELRNQLKDKAENEVKKERELQKCRSDVAKLEETLEALNIDLAQHRDLLVSRAGQLLQLQERVAKLEAEKQ